MFEKPEVWNQLSPEEKRKLRLDHWEKSEGLEFFSPRAEANYIHISDKVEAVMDVILQESLAASKNAKPPGRRTR
jgi:hypothetical protein